MLNEESCSGRICGYITVKTAEGKEAGYVAIYAKHKLPLALFAALYGIYIAVPLTVLAVVSLTYLIVSNRPRDMPEEKASEIPVAEDVTEYDDSPVPIETDTAADEVNAEGNVSFNAYSGDYNVAEGDSIPLNNISTNDVYLRYLLYTSSGQGDIYIRFNCPRNPDRFYTFQLPTTGQDGCENVCGMLCLRQSNKISRQLHI